MKKKNALIDILWSNVITKERNRWKPVEMIENFSKNDMKWKWYVMKDTIICQKSDPVTLRTACTKKALKYETKYKRNYVDRSIYQDLSKVTEIPQLPTEDPKKAKPHPLL